jgi:hypothetical protein
MIQKYANEKTNATARTKALLASASLPMPSRINPQENDGIAIQRNPIRRATIVDSPALIRSSISPNGQNRDRNEPREC